MKSLRCREKHGPYRSFEYNKVDLTEVASEVCPQQQEKTDRVKAGWVQSHGQKQGDQMNCDRVRWGQMKLGHCAFQKSWMGGFGVFPEQRNGSVWGAGRANTLI